MMKTAKQREEEFRKEFEELLKKHGAVICADEYGWIEVLLFERSEDGENICYQEFTL